MMKMTYPTSPPNALKLGLAGLALMLGFAATGAHAAGTASGTTIGNLATLSYSVGGVAQPNIGSSSAGNSSGAGAATTFVVDRKINILVQKQGVSATSVIPGQTAAVSTFLVTNLGNDTQDLLISGANLPTGTADPFGSAATDNFDATACTVRVDANGNGIYEPAIDTGTFVDELAANGTKTVFVLCDIPTTQVNGDFAVGAVTATAYSGGSPGALGTVMTETAGANTAGVDTVFADGAGSDDAARDGKFSDRNAFLVSAATLSVSKTMQVVCDPFNATTNPKAIPGAIVTWTITVSNAAGAGASATLSQVTDALNANTTLDPNLVTGAGGAAGCSSASGTPENGAGKAFHATSSVGTRPVGASTGTAFFTSATDADGIDLSAATVTIDYSKVLPAGGSYTAGELKPNESISVHFNVTIN